MTFKERCIKYFQEWLDENGKYFSQTEKDFMMHIYKSAFDFGSLNGASEDIQNGALENVYPKSKKEKIDDIIRKLKSI